ncbi:MAG: hypothetical protein ACREQV_23135, partial [Candidatus Binatia bacterium]
GHQQSNGDRSVWSQVIVGLDPDATTITGSLPVEEILVSTGGPLWNKSLKVPGFAGAGLLLFAEGETRRPGIAWPSAWALSRLRSPGGGKIPSQTFDHC